jgi:hypothetical protein
VFEVSFAHSSHISVFERRVEAMVAWTVVTRVLNLDEKTVEETVASKVVTSVGY